MLNNLKDKCNKLYWGFVILFILLSSLSYIANLNSEIAFFLLDRYCVLMALGWFYTLPVWLFSFFLKSIDSKVVGLTVACVLGILSYSILFYSYYRLISRIKSKKPRILFCSIPFIIILIFLWSFSSLLC